MGEGVDIQKIYPNKPFMAQKNTNASIFLKHIWIQTRLEMKKGRTQKGDDQRRQQRQDQSRGMKTRRLEFGKVKLLKKRCPARNLGDTQASEESEMERLFSMCLHVQTRLIWLWLYLGLSVKYHSNHNLNSCCLFSYQLAILTFILILLQNTTCIR